MNYDILKITAAEIDVMKALWKTRRPMTVKQISELVPERSVATVSTLLDRLDRKGILEYFISDGRRVYVPYISAFIYKALLLQNILSNLFDGSYADMASVLLSCMDLTPAEMERVKERVLEADERLRGEEREAVTKENVNADCIEDTEAENPENTRILDGMSFLNTAPVGIERMFINIKKAQITRRVCANRHPAFCRPRGDPDAINPQKKGSGKLPKASHQYSSAIVSVMILFVLPIRSVCLFQRI